MKKQLLLCLSVFVTLAACQQTEESREENSQEENAVASEGRPDPALCNYAGVDSVTAQAWLKGEWELAGVKPTSMGTQTDELLTGEKIGTPKGLVFYSNNEFEQTVNGQKEGQRQKYTLQGQSLSPLAYQFWFCGINTLVLSNVAADGPTEVYIRK